MASIEGSRRHETRPHALTRGDAGSRQLARLLFLVGLVRLSGYLSANRLQMGLPCHLRVILSTV